MANMAVSRIKREFKEVMRSEEVSKKIFKNIKHAHTQHAFQQFPLLGRACSPRMREKEREFQGLAVTSTDFESNFGAEFVNN